MHNTESSGNRLIDHILKAIAINEPFSIEELTSVYNEITSIDKLVDLIYLAKEQNCSLSEVREEKPEMKLGVTGSIKLGFDVGPE